MGHLPIDHEAVKSVAELATALSNAIVVRKGIFDLITDGKQAMFVCNEGSSKRCGGIGDILAGTIGTFVQFDKNLTTN
jgi:ATP-dependent NAD(P)H-hydrate dehydratase